MSPGGLLRRQDPGQTDSRHNQPSPVTTAHLACTVTSDSLGALWLAWPPGKCKGMYSHTPAQLQRRGRHSHLWTFPGVSAADKVGPKPQLTHRQRATQEAGDPESGNAQAGRRKTRPKLEHHRKATQRGDLAKKHSHSHECMYVLAVPAPHPRSRWSLHRIPGAASTESTTQQMSGCRAAPHHSRRGSVLLPAVALW